MLIFQNLSEKVCVKRRDCARALEASWSVRRMTAEIECRRIWKAEFRKKNDPLFGGFELRNSETERKTKYKKLVTKKKRRISDLYPSLPP